MEMGKVARKREFSILQTPPTEKLAKLGEVNVEEKERAVSACGISRKRGERRGVEFYRYVKKVKG